LGTESQAAESALSHSDALSALDAAREEWLGGRVGVNDLWTAAAAVALASELEVIRV
jgi:predicted nucleic acid-binding protein